MSIDNRIIRSLQLKAGCNVSTPHGAAILRNDIECATGQHLSLNTIKRLVGVIEYDGLPRLSTLDIIAQYLGFMDWKHLNHVSHTHTNSAFYWERPFIDLRAEPIGTILTICWGNDPRPKNMHRIDIVHLGEGKYIVRRAKNTKLQENDILLLSIVAVKYPLAISEVTRGEENLGAYIAGIDGGVSNVRRENKKRKAWCSKNDTKPLQKDS